MTVANVALLPSQLMAITLLQALMSEDHKWERLCDGLSHKQLHPFWMSKKPGRVYLKLAEACNDMRQIGGLDLPGKALRVYDRRRRAQKARHRMLVRSRLHMFRIHDAQFIMTKMGSQCPRAGPTATAMIPQWSVI